MMDDFLYDVEWAAITDDLRKDTSTGAFSANAWYLLEEGIPAICAMHWAHEDYVTWEGMLRLAADFPRQGRVIRPAAGEPPLYWNEVVEELFNGRTDEVGNDEQP